MNKQKLFSFLSILGVIFVIALGVSYTKALKNRGDVIANKVEVPAALATQFGRVITKNRVEAMPKLNFLAPDGKSVSWSDFDGNYLLVNFWATWCAPCVVELPSLDRLQKRFEGKGLEVISVSIDHARTQEQVKKFIYNRNIGEFAGYYDAKGDIQRNLRMRGIPTSYLLDPKGNILHIFEGDANWSSSSAIAFFTSVLNQQNL